MTEGFVTYLWLRFGDLNWSRLHFYWEGGWPSVAWKRTPDSGEYYGQDQPGAVRLVPFTAQRFPG